MSNAAIARDARARHPAGGRERSAEQRERHGAVTKVARQLGIGSESLRPGLCHAEIDVGQRPSLTSEERERLKPLERENRELWRANEILKCFSLLRVYAP